MANVLNIASSGLQAFQRAIATTGENIDNVGTAGYSRQTVDLQTRDSTRFGEGFIGNGVDVAAIRRNTDYFATRQIRDAQSLYQGINEFHVNAKELDGLLSGDSTSINIAMQQFFSAMHAVNSNPTDTSSRQVLLSQTNELVSRFHRMSEQLDQQVTELNGQLSAMVANVTSLAQSLADVNKKIVGGGVVSSELLDKRDSIVKEIAGYIAIQAVEESDGSLSLSIGNGISLVTGGTATKLTTQRSDENPEYVAVAIELNNQTFQVTNHLEGGKIGGILNYREGMLEEARSSINRIALVVADQLNSQNQLGMDLKGNLGRSIFSDINSTMLQTGRAIQNNDNSGTMQLSVAINDVSQLTTSNYRLNVSTGPAYQLVRLSDNTATPIGSFPVTVDGFTIQIDAGTASAGDSFIIDPNKSAASLMKVNINSTNDFAIASPIRTSRGTSNTGSGSISAGEVIDSSTSAFTTSPGSLTPPVRVEFLSATTYQLVNVTTSATIEGPLSYDPNVENNLFPTAGSYDPGYRVSITGAVQTGDQFSIGYNTAGVADNRNGNAMTHIQTKNIIESGTTSMQAAYGGLISDVGTQTHQAKINSDASELLLEQSEARLDNVAGVNLDEEAANLLKFQQAYQAAAQVISVATRMFDTLMSAFQ